MFLRIIRYADHELGRTLATWLFVFVAVFASSGVHAHAGMVSFDGSLPHDKSSITDVNLFFASDFGAGLSLWSGYSVGFHANSVPAESFAAEIVPAVLPPYESVEIDFERFGTSSGCDTHCNSSGSVGSHAAENAVNSHFAELVSLSLTSWLKRIKLLAIPSGLPIELLRPPKLDLDRCELTS